MFLTRRRDQSEAQEVPNETRKARFSRCGERKENKEPLINSVRPELVEG